MIALPGALQVSLRTALHQYPTATWSAAAQALSQRYRGPRDGSVLVRNALDALAYTALIMPSTYAQLYGAFAQITLHHTWQATSLLDLGSGPGTTSWVAHQFCTTLQHITAVERDPFLQAVARTLAGEHTLPPTTYVAADITTHADWAPHDIVVIGHVLNELNAAQRAHVIKQAWQATTQLLLIVEPGTPAFFPIIKSARQQLITAGAHVIGPCTHHHDCPLPADQWCHFGQKIARPEGQRAARGSELGWEEAKFTYVACGRTPATPRGLRILHDPIRAKGSIDVVGCDTSGIHTYRALKRDTQHYAVFRRTQWGGFIAAPKEDT